MFHVISSRLQFYLCGDRFLILTVNLTGDLERKFDLEISPLCNQQADTIPAIQIGGFTHHQHQLLCHHES